MLPEEFPGPPAFLLHELDLGQEPVPLLFHGRQFGGGLKDLFLESIQKRGGHGIKVAENPLCRKIERGGPELK